MRVRVCVCVVSESSSGARLLVGPSSEVSAVTGSNVSLECVADDRRPAHSVTWKRLDDTPLPRHRHRQMTGGCSLSACLSVCLSETQS